MNVKLALLADYANITREGKLNILGIFDRIGAQNFPVIHSQMHLVIELQADSIEAGQTKVIDVHLVDADGNKLFTIPNSIKLGKSMGAEPINANQIIVLNGFKFEKPGDYAFKILINGEHKRDVLLKVIQIKSQETSS